MKVNGVSLQIHAVGV